MHTESLFLEKNIWDNNKNCYIKLSSILLQIVYNNNDFLKNTGLRKSCIMISLFIHIIQSTYLGPNVYDIHHKHEQSCCPNKEEIYGD